jgi:hypothetical protein
MGLAGWLRPFNTFSPDCTPPLNASPSRVSAAHSQRVDPQAPIPARSESNHHNWPEVGGWEHEGRREFLRRGSWGRMEKHSLPGISWPHLSRHLSLWFSLTSLTFLLVPEPQRYTFSTSTLFRNLYLETQFKTNFLNSPSILGRFGHWNQQLNRLDWRTSFRFIRFS